MREQLKIGMKKTEYKDRHCIIIFEGQIDWKERCRKWGSQARSAIEVTVSNVLVVTSIHSNF